MMEIIMSTQSNSMILPRAPGPPFKILPKNPHYPMLLNWNDQVFALFYTEDRIYKKSTVDSAWSVEFNSLGFFIGILTKVK